MKYLFKTLTNPKLLLILILLIGSILRIYKIESIPPHLTPDEASLGYNAYSILKTGRDEYGEFAPAIFKSFGDYKPGLYVYYSVPSVALFGLSEFSVRFPSALAGIVSIYLLYLIVRLLFKDSSKRQLYAISAAALLALNPWHIHFSRGAWEINLNLMLTLAAVYFFLKALEKHYYLAVSAVCFALTVLTYQGAKLSSGLLVLILMILYWKKVFKFKVKILVPSVALGVIFSLPIILSFFTGKVGRLAVFSVFSYRRPAELVESVMTNEGKLNYYFFHSETLNLTRGILGRYFNHYSDRFLFFEGDWQNLRHAIPNHGMFLVVDIILFVLGLFMMTRLKDKKAFLFILLWLLLAPLPSALSRDQVHAVRAYNLLVPLVLVNSLGVVFIVTKLKNIKSHLVKSSLLVFMLGVYLINYTYFIDGYFTHLPVHNAKYWMYGYKQVVEYVSANQDMYSEIRVQQDYSQPYIYFLFHQKYDPTKYQSQARLVDQGLDVGWVEEIDKIKFTQLHWTPKNGKVLVVSDAAKVVPENATLLKEIYYPDGLVAFRISETLEK